MKEILEETKSRMNKTIEALEKELLTIRTGRASSSMLDRVEVMYYGFKTPLNQVASISIPEPRQILIKAYEKSILKDVEKGIIEANLGFNPINDGTVIRINVPVLTEDRRKELVKLVFKIAEENKVSIRNIRRDSNDLVKKEKDLSEDVKKNTETEIQKITDEFTNKIDSIAREKESDVMSV